MPVFYVVDNGVEAGIYIDNIGAIFKDKNRLLLGSTSSTAISETSNAYTSTSSLALPINFNNKIGTTFEANQFAHIIKLVDTLNKKNIKVRSVLLRPYTDADIVITDEGGSLRVNLDSDPEKLIVNFNAIRKTEPFKTQFLENRPRLHYVDLRFGNKVFYKFSGTGTTTNETKL